MKIKDGFIMRHVAGSYAVVPVGNASKDFNGLIKLNESGAALWKKLEEGSDEEGLITCLTSLYETDRDTAKSSVEKFLSACRKAGLIDE